ncbi:rod shape-determining protein RodA [bacterium endosymbiont of Pedicinus badii]|uniref:rod shape-determining protein RodA n=1 Tax=bacterium endosymbiont of Pedicinus badii TaxID=1719126 RepID=UPI0009BB8DA2|nr:rod shape-determining protein RodA [bacterium endosymbiont of Pedicinus badii]OQM34306.1 rod shape-determining protein RodA [bacterium endosymbiont of Pedicinus badii]
MYLLKNKIYFNKKKSTNFFKNLYFDKILLFFIFLVLICSIFIIWSATGKSISIVKKRILHILFGTFAMFFFTKIPSKFYKIFSFHLYIVFIILLILVECFGKISNGAKRWIEIGIIKFQPSEFAKIIVPFTVAKIIYKKNPKNLIKKVIFSIFLTIIPTILIANQPDLGTAVLTFFSSFSIIFLSGINFFIIFIILLLTILLIPIIWIFFMYEYQKARITSMIYPEKDILGSSYHIIQSKIAIGSGGITGKGWLKGTQSQLDFLPERHTDFIFAVLGEEFGLLGILLVIFLYMGIIMRCLFIAHNTSDSFKKIVIGNTVLVFFIYIFTNISMVIGIFPVVGIPLPLVSYGGSTLVVFMIEFGIIMSMQSKKKFLQDLKNNA